MEKAASSSNKPQDCPEVLQAARPIEDEQVDKDAIEMLNGNDVDFGEAVDDPDLDNAESALLEGSAMLFQMRREDAAQYLMLGFGICAFTWKITPDALPLDMVCVQLCLLSPPFNWTLSDLQK